MHPSCHLRCLLQNRVGIFGHNPRLKHLCSSTDRSFPGEDCSLYAQNAGAQKNSCDKHPHPTTPPWAASDELPGAGDELPAARLPRGTRVTSEQEEQGMPRPAKNQTTQQSSDTPRSTRPWSHEQRCHQRRRDLKNSLKNNQQSKYLFL